MANIPIGPIAGKVLNFFPFKLSSISSLIEELIEKTNNIYYEISFEFFSNKTALTTTTTTTTTLKLKLQLATFNFELMK